MNTGIRTVFATVGVALSAVLLFAGSSALGQQRDSAGKGARTQEQITVTGPRLVISHIGSQHTQAGGFGYDTLSLTHQVSYADLDLTSPADALELKERVDDTAKKVCRELAKLRPVQPANSSSTADCYSQAYKGAIKQAEAAIAAAKK